MDPREAGEELTDEQQEDTYRYASAALFIVTLLAVGTGLLYLTDMRAEVCYALPPLYAVVHRIFFL
jgi:hypothetical protein